MAASSSKSFTSKEYDVFISFRGEDTRHNFTSHLFSALSRNSIRAFIDHELNKGDEISSSLIKAIQESYGSLVIFSENYASSKWCLDELVKILECRKQGHFVIPVFYNIDPSHVRKQTGSYGKAFSIHEQDSKNKEKLQTWKAALTEAANIVGWDSRARMSRDESELIQNIVNDILQKMNHIFQPFESSYVGIDKYCEEIELRLQRYLGVGIWGMGGVGKTTIAKVVFDKLFCQYDYCYFFENIREESEKNGLNYIHAKLLAELLKDENFHSSTPKAPMLKFAMRRLRDKKVLVVLDDVNTSEQIKHLQQECNCLGANSRVIITTRDKHVLVGLDVDYVIYEVKGLDLRQSLHLFKLNAFNKKYPERGYEEITKKVVSYANGNPLALKVLGSFLLSKSKEEWESALAKLNKIPNDDIQKVLKLSYDALDHGDQKIFLDIACFFKGEHIKDVISLLDSFGFYRCIGIRNLQDKALVAISENQRVLMHDLIQEMGLDIIKNPRERSRLCDPKEIYDVLANNKGTSAVEGIILNTSRIKDLRLKTDAFENMNNLRFLKFYCTGESCKVQLPPGIEFFSDELRYLHWDRFPFHSLTSTFCAENLVELRMPNSHITKLWDGPQHVINLKKIQLHGCRKLMELPDLSNASKLERVDLSWCSNLCHIHPSLLQQDALIELKAHNCEKLESLQTESHLKSLKQLSFHNCSNLKEFSLSSEKIEELLFWGTAVDTLPSSVGRCKNLKILTFCHSLKKMPREISKSRSIKVLKIEEGIGFDSSLLHDMFDAFPSLVELLLADCDELFQLPDNISVLSSLNVLGIERSNLESLPTSIKHLPCLKCLNVSHCQRLQSLPELPPSLIRLEARYCSSLETLFPSTVLRHCDLEGCVKLDQQTLYDVMTYAHNRIKLASAETIRVCWPGDSVPWWFIYRTTQTEMTIQLPSRSDLLDIAFCITVSHYLLQIRCACYLEDSGTKKFVRVWYCDGHSGLVTNNVYLWYNCGMCGSYLKAMKGRGRVSFRLFANDSEDLRPAIKEFGVSPIYATELELELGDKLKRTLEADEPKQLPLTKKLKKFQPQLKLGLNIESHTYLDIQGIVIDDYNHEDQDEQEPLLIDKKMKREVFFQQLPTEPKKNDTNEAFDFFHELEFGDKFKRCQFELEGDKQQLSSSKKFKESTHQLVPLGLELELNTKSYTYLDIEGIQVGVSDKEKQDEHEPLGPDKGIQGI